ncbi:hypothetical protein WN944_027315 [Citrus x changshan-huyou]|uniref:Uncharacterized protein n=1 Tax=Citrus x changshan-huyou TaxID=2935761 RepID=A0AAP0Q9S1_9ROSI
MDANNSTKLLSSQSDGSHCWTFFSTTAYREGNKVPLNDWLTWTSIKHNINTKGNMAREDKWDKTLQTKYMRQAQEQMRAIVSLFAFGK